MALAYLLKNVDSDIFGYNLRPTAFIVDHAARSDSEKEAELAASWCERLGKWISISSSRVTDSLVRDTSHHSKNFMENTIFSSSDAEF